MLIITACQDESSEGNVSEKPATGTVDPILQDYEVPERKIGFINENGEIVIEATFDEVRNFSQSRAAVNQEGLWGYINPSGEWVIPSQYLGAWTFNHGMGRVQSAQNRLFGYVGIDGDTLVNLVYDEARDFKGKLAGVRKGEFWGVIDTKGKEVIPPQYDNVEILSAEYIAVSDKGMWGVYHLIKELIIPHLYLDIYSLRGNIFRVKNGNGKYLYIDMQNQAVFDEVFFKAYDPQEGIFAVCDSVDRCYLIDRTGARKSEIFQNLHPGNEGLFIAKTENGWGVLESDGSMLVPFRYDLIYNFEEGFAPYLQDNLWGYLSKNGQVMTPPQFGLAWPFQNGKARVLTRTGTVILNTSFEVEVDASMGEIRDFHEGLAAFKAY